jgi:hypothetical protein
MTITIDSAFEEQVRRKAHAQGTTVENYIERLIREDAEWEHLEEPLDETDPEFEEIRSAVMEGLGEVERGDVRSAREVFAELRSKHGLSG